MSFSVDFTEVCAEVHIHWNIYIPCSTLCLPIHALCLWYFNWACEHDFNTFRPRQNCRHFAGDIFKYIFLNENIRISLKISLKSVPNVLITNIPTLVQIMAWRRPGTKPLSEPMMVILVTNMCVTRPQWVKQTAKQTIFTDFHNILWVSDFFSISNWKLIDIEGYWYKCVWNNCLGFF